MPEGAELTLGVLFAGRIDESFRRQTDRLRNILSGLSKTMTGTGAAMGSTKTSARGMADEFSNVGKKISKVEGGFQRLTAAMKVTASYGLAGTVLFGTIRALKQGITEIANFDQALKNLQAITSATDYEILALRDVILDVAEKTKYSAQEVSEATITLGQAGFTAAESLDVIGAVARLATGTLSSMKDTSDLLTSALRAFGENAQQASRFADIFASAINKSKLDVQKLRTAFNYLGPVASQVGLNLEETAASTMLLANAGLRGSTIGTGFRRTLQLLVKPTDNLKILFATAGANLDKLNPAVASMSEVVGELEKVLGRSVPAAERARRAFEIFGLRGANVASAMAQAGVKGFETMLKEVYRVGVSAKMADKQMEGLATMAKNLADRMVNLAIAIGEGGVADAFRVLLPLLRSTVSAFTYLVDTTLGRTIVAFTVLSSTLALLRLSLRYLATQFIAVAGAMSIASAKTYIAENGLLISVLKGVKDALKGIYSFLKANPWFLLATAISAVAVGIYSFTRRQAEVIPNLRKEAVELDRTVANLIDYKRRLGEAKEGSMEYRAILERLITDFPELAHRIDLVNGKFLDQGKALDELVAKQKRLRVENMINQFDVMEKRLAKIRKEIREYEERIKVIGLDEPSIDRMKDRITAAKKELKDLLDDFGIIYERVGDILLDQGLSLTSSFSQIKAAIQDTFGLGAKSAENLAGYVESFFERMRLLQNLAKGDALSAAERLEAMLAGLSKEYGTKWLEQYRKIGNARKADLIETVFALEKKIEETKKTAEEQGWTEEMLVDKLRQLHEEEYQNFLAKESAKERKARELRQEVKEDLLKYLKETEEAEKIAADNKAKDRKQEVIENVAGEKERQALIKDILEIAENEKILITEKYARKRRDLIEQITEMELDTRADSVEGEIAIEIHKANKLKDKLLDEVHDRELYAELVARIEAALQKTIADIRQKWADKDEGTRKQRMVNLEEEYRLGLINAQQYYDSLDRLLEDHLASERDIWERKRRINESIWTSLKYGWEDAYRGILSLSELMYNIGSTVSEQIGSSFADALWEFIESTKTGAEAFEDFAKSVLSWLTKMIAQWIIMKGIQGGFGQKTQWYAYQGHSGGTIGATAFQRRRVDPRMFDFAPRLHKGLRSDEYPAILQRGEEVLSKKDAGKTDKDVIVIVNEAPPGTKVSKDNSNKDLTKIVIDVNAKDIAKGGTLDKTLRSTYGLTRRVAMR